MTFSFNLIEEPFIPCLLLDGAAVELGLKDALLRAPAIREVRDDSPLVTVALHRLLLAILHRNFGPANLKAWKHLWQAGGWDQGTLADYWQRWQGRFDLFDREHPFYQEHDPRIEEPSSVSRLAHELTSGNNATLFDHTIDAAPPALSAAEAARLVIAHQALAPSAGKSPTGHTKDAPLVRGAIVLVQGRTLFETLMLNLLAYNAEEPIPARGDAPAWERNGGPPFADSPTPAGYLDYLTWQSRTLMLHPEVLTGRPIVRYVSYGQGRKFDAPGLFDPMMAYRRHEQTGWRPLRLNERKELWRDSGALFQLADARVRRPGCFNWLARLVGDGVLTPGQQFDFAVFGLCSDQAKVHFWRHDRMPLPLAYLNDEDLDLVASLGQALKQAEEVGRVLHGNIRLLASLLLVPNGKKVDRNRLQPLVDSLASTRLYWSRLEVPFRAFLVRLAESGDDHERVVARWVNGELCRQAWIAFEQTAGGLDSTARVLRAVTQARRRLARYLAAVRHPYEEVLHDQGSSGG